MHNKPLNELILSIAICESTRKSTRKRIVVSANLELFSRDSGILTEIASTTKPFAGRFANQRKTLPTSTESGLAFVGVKLISARSLQCLAVWTWHIGHRCRFATSVLIAPIAARRRRSCQFLEQFPRRCWASTFDKCSQSFSESLLS